ncbi:hypothetical protein L1987_72449 [Smallanthus sonchifolius]|uniref:Uncharacterized protein n=1 Tax=Smallanthus sonchifolius TaxID=185202 RepID=A0ACB9AVJ1_9ASTR|nr:hypothetical protein L1987_72449 [Smallanthus sonchifolius]
MENAQNMEVDSQAIEEVGNMGDYEGRLGDACPWENLVRQPQRSLGIGSQEMILRPKKKSIPSPLRSSLEDTRPRKRSRAVSEELFDLNKLLGTCLFGGNVEADDFEDGEIRDEGMGVQSSSHINVMDLNRVASPGESVVPSPSSTGDNEVVMESMADKGDDELNATLKIGEIVGARLENFNELVKNTIEGEGINGVHQ